MYTESEVMDFIKEEDVKFIRLAYFDLSGKQKNVSVLADEIEKIFKGGFSFDASAIEGFESPEKSDLYLHPDPSTLSVLPWRPTSGKVVRMFCDIKYPDGRPYEKDSRHLLRTAVEKAKKEYDLTLDFGTEFEFYLFKLDENGNPTKIPFDNAGFMDIAPEDKGENIRREIDITLEQMGIVTESSHHEEGPGQNEVDFQYSDALTAADNASTFKWIVRTKAAANGLYADFDPKPLSDKPGNGMHINISSSKSEYLPMILAGIMDHLPEITYYLNPTKNSYDRLGELKAPKYIAWGHENRSTVIRVPASKDEKRIEIRSSDAGANPYIAFTLLLHAAMDGIKNKMDPLEPCEENLFKHEIAEKYNYRPVPDTLSTAKDLAEKSVFIRKIFNASCEDKNGGEKR